MKTNANDIFYILLLGLCHFIDFFSSSCCHRCIFFEISLPKSTSFFMEKLTKNHADHQKEKIYSSLSTQRHQAGT